MQLRSPIIFCFGNHGTQYKAMGLGLYEQCHRFRYYFNHYHNIVKNRCGLDLIALLRNPHCHWWEHEVGSQIMLLAYQCALAYTFMDCGIKPQAVFGHSFGEIPALVVAKTLTMGEALQFICYRAQLLQQLPTHHYGMLAVKYPVAELKPWLATSYPTIDIANVNHPWQTVIAGKYPHLKQCKHMLQQQKIKSTWLPVRYAFHSQAMQPVAAQLAAQWPCAPLPAPNLAFYRNRDGQVANKIDWQDIIWQMVEPVRFDLCCHNIATDWPEACIIEISPKQLVSGLIKHNSSKLFTINPAQAYSDEVFECQYALIQCQQLGYRVDWTMFMHSVPSKTSVF